jgi:electron transport complex protein RnfG
MTLPSLRHGFILGAFCLGFGLVLAAIDQVTIDDIAARALEDRQNSLSQVLAGVPFDNNPATDTVRIENADHGRSPSIAAA